MNTFYDRLKAEKAELDDKIGKLESFLESEKVKDIDHIQASLLQIQFNAMMTYTQILVERLRYIEQQQN